MPSLMPIRVKSRDLWSKKDLCSKYKNQLLQKKSYVGEFASWNLSYINWDSPDLATLMSFDPSHLFWYLHSWIPLSMPIEFSECLKFAQVIGWLLLSRRNFVPSHLIPIQRLQKLVFSVTILWGLQYLDQLPTFKLVDSVGSNNVWLFLLSIVKKTKDFK